MTKEEFFTLTPETRSSLIKKAHDYYAKGFSENLNKVVEPDVREFISMCIDERIKYEFTHPVIF